MGITDRIEPGVFGVEANPGLPRLEVDPGSRDFFDRLQRYSMVWLSIALIKKTAGDLSKPKYRAESGTEARAETRKWERAEARAWAKNWRRRYFYDKDGKKRLDQTSLARCCEWISSVLPDGAQIDPRAMSYLILHHPARVRALCDRYLQENLPDFGEICRMRPNLQKGRRDCAAVDDDEKGGGSGSPWEGLLDEQMTFAF